jgi:hypothetical protein
MHQDYYNDKNEKVPSVTTVLKILNKDGLLHWSNYIGKRGIDYEKYLNEKALFGTLVHELLESDLTNREPTVIGFDRYMSEAMELVQKFKVVKSDLQISNVITEIPLVCDTYGGTIDLICDIATTSGNIKILGDFKTSKTVYETQFIQLGGYLNLLKIQKPEIYDEIKQCVIFSITKSKIVMRYITKEECEQHFTSMFLSLLDVYHKWENAKAVYKTIYKSKTY